MQVEAYKTKHLPTHLIPVMVMLNTINHNLLLARLGRDISTPMTSKKNNQPIVSRIESKLSIPVIILIVIVWTTGMTYAMTFIKTDDGFSDDAEVIWVDGSELEAAGADQPPSDTGTEARPIEGGN
jgi:hypothetical protein